MRTYVQEVTGGLVMNWGPLVARAVHAIVLWE